MKQGRDQSFPRSARLVSRDFREVLRSGKRHKTGSLLLCCRKRPEGEPRLGVVVPRRFGKANCRNRFKRLVREVFRKHRSEMAPGTDLVLRTLPGRTSFDYREIEKVILETLRTVGMIRSQPRTLGEEAERN